MILVSISNLIHQRICDLTGVKPPVGVAREHQRMVEKSLFYYSISMAYEFRAVASVNLRTAHQAPVFGMLCHGSAGASGSPFCSNSTEIMSGERTKAMRPSRGGRLIVTPCSCRRLQAA